MIIFNENGITIGQIRELIKDLPDDGEVWIGKYENSNYVTEIAHLNGTNSDIILEAKNHTNYRYLVFDCPTYYPLGGMSDLVGKFETLEEAKEFKSKNTNYHIFDLADL